MTNTAAYEEWTYHGSITRVGGQLVVESPNTDGSAGRDKVKVLHVWEADGEYDFGWGYHGTGTHTTASVVLAHALGLGDPSDAGIWLMGGPGRNETLIKLCGAFANEVLMQLEDEWRLARIAVLRWALGWYTQQGISPMPVTLRRLPPPGAIGLPPEKW
jgi:hypothetical protein